MFRWVRLLVQRIRLAVSVLRRGLPERDAESEQAVRDVLSSRRRPGFPCPQCGERIVVDIPSLLSRCIVRCPRCRLELKIDWDEDERARQALERVQLAAEEVSRAKAFRR